MERSERSRFGFRLRRDPVPVPEDIYEREVSRITSDPTVPTDFVAEEVQYLRELHGIPEPVQGEDETIPPVVREIVREAIDKNVETGNIREVQELIHVKEVVPNVQQRFDLVHDAYQNNVTLSRTEGSGDVNHAQRLLDQFTVIRDRYVTEMRDVWLQPGKTENLPEYSYGDDD